MDETELRMDEVAKLRMAGRLLAEVRNTLNQGQHMCECCGLTVYEDDREWVQRQMLNAAIQRVDKVVKEMERKRPGD